jgi:hypothetical protein
MKTKTPATAPTSDDYRNDIVEAVQKFLQESGSFDHIQRINFLFQEFLESQAQNGIMPAAKIAEEVYFCNVLTSFIAQIAELDSQFKFNLRKEGKL